MNREQYKIEAAKRVSKTYVDYVNMPKLLEEMAIWCFLNKEAYSEFAKTTRDRLKELNRVGKLNWD